MQSALPPGPPSPTSPDLMAALEDGVQSSSASPELAPSDSVSPTFSPRTKVPSGAGAASEFAPSVLPSPALGPAQSPDQSSRHVWPSSSASPDLQPRQSGSSNRESDVDREASAALLMLNRDSRGSLNSTSGVTAANSPSDSRDEEFTDENSLQKRVSMNVRDLLNS